jgi:hypothetical protein
MHVLRSIADGALGRANAPPAGRTAPDDRLAPGMQAQMRMKRTTLLLAALGALFGSTAYATVDAFMPYRIVYRSLQTDDLCIGEHTMWAELGIPPASMAIASASPTLIFRQSSSGNGQVDINLASTQPPMVPIYVDDSYSSTGVLDYSMRLDVSALNAANGTSAAGRAATIQAAKVYLIAMAENLRVLEGTGWRLRVQFVGLPSQSGLAGTHLYPMTVWPYTVGSPLLNAYYDELIDTDGTCD